MRLGWPNSETSLSHILRSKSRKKSRKKGQVVSIIIDGGSRKKGQVVSIIIDGGWGFRTGSGFVVCGRNHGKLGGARSAFQHEHEHAEHGEEHTE
jgi:hypothetical protein